LIHGLWNTSSIFSSITSKLDDIGIEYFAPTLKHSYGMTSILDLSFKLNELILEKYGLKKEIDIDITNEFNIEEIQKAQLSLESRETTGSVILKF